MGTKPKRLKRWFPWADRAVGTPGMWEDLKVWGKWGKKAYKVLGTAGFPVAVVVAQWNLIAGWVVDNSLDAVIYITGAVLSASGIYSIVQDRRRASLKLTRGMVPETKTWSTEPQAIRLLERSAWIESWRPEGDLDGLEGIPLQQWRSGRRVTHGDDILHELARKALADFSAQHPGAVRDDLYSKEALEWWIATQTAKQVGFS